MHANLFRADNQDNKLHISAQITSKEYSMTNLLRIDTSARTNDSHSRRLADRFLDSWLQTHPECRVVRRDLAVQPPPHINNDTIAGFYTPADQVTDIVRTVTAYSDRLISELRAADLLLLSVPMYNFSIPSTLKAWIDHISRFGQTFEYDSSRGYVGLLQGKRAVVATSAGAVISAEPMTSLNFVTPYLKALLTFLGFSSVDILSLEGSTSDDGAFAQSLAATNARIEKLVRNY
jgi:FMN-dependent NADH-azoreductase